MARRTKTAIAILAVLAVGLILFTTYFELMAPSQVTEEITPWRHPFLTVAAQMALDEANGQLEAMELGDIRTVDQTSPDFRARFFRNNNWEIHYWEFEDGDTQIRVDASTGEIFDYFSTHETMEGPRMPEDEVRDYVERVMAQFAPVPELTGEPQVDHSMWCMYAVEMENGTIVYRDMYEDWDFFFYRTVDGIPTSDGFWVWIEVDGTLINYEKEWFMDLDDLDIGFTVTREEAETAAIEAISRELGQGNITSGDSWQEIVWPKTMDGENDVLGDPIPLWVVEVYWNVGDEGWSYYYQVLVRGQGKGETLSITEFCG